MRGHNNWLSRNSCAEPKVLSIFFIFFLPTSKSLLPALVVKARQTEGSVGILWRLEMLLLACQRRLWNLWPVLTESFMILEMTLGFSLSQIWTRSSALKSICNFSKWLLIIYACPSEMFSRPKALIRSSMQGFVYSTISL